MAVRVKWADLESIRWFQSHCIRVSVMSPDTLRPSKATSGLHKIVSSIRPANLRSSFIRAARWQTWELNINCKTKIKVNRFSPCIGLMTQAEAKHGLNRFTDWKAMKNLVGDEAVPLLPPDSDLIPLSIPPRLLSGDHKKTDDGARLWIMCFSPFHTHRTAGIRSKKGKILSFLFVSISSS